MKFGYYSITNPLDSVLGTESRSIFKSNIIKIEKSDFFVSEKIMDLGVVFFMNKNEEDFLNTYKNIASGESKFKIMRFKGVFIPPIAIEKVIGKTVRANLKPKFKELKENRADYKMVTVATNERTFKSLSYGMNLNYILDEVKSKTFDKDIKMNKPLRKDVLNIIKSRLETHGEGKEKTIYLTGPFLKGTGIHLNVTDTLMKNIWSPTALLLEWMSDDIDGFKAFMKKNKINIVMDNKNGQYLVLGRTEKFITNPMYNYKYIIKLIHILDGVSPEELNLTTDESNLLNSDTTNETIIITPTDDGDDVNVVEEDDEIPELMIDDEFVDDKVAKKTLAELNKIFDEVPEKDRGEAIIELHNYRDLKKEIEVPAVKKMRRAMTKKYGRDVETTASLIKKHKLDVVTFKNTVENGYNHSTFLNLDKTYQERISEEDKIGSLLAPSNLSIPLFLKDLDVTDISNREFRGELWKIKYETFQGEELEMEIEVPKIVNNSLFIGGSYKYLTNQNLAKPIIKQDENVIITMAYNKSILKIKGKYGSVDGKVFVNRLKLFGVGLREKTTTELSDFIYKNRVSYTLLNLNRHYGGISYKDDSLLVRLDFRGMEESDTDDTLIGFINKKQVYHDPEKDTMWIDPKEKKSTVDFISSILDSIDHEKWESTSKVKLNNTKFVNGVYCEIMSRELPVIYVILVETPLKDLLERLRDENGLEYSIVKNERLGDLSKLKNDVDYAYIKLSDFTIRIKYNNIINQLLLIPLVNTDLSDYSAFDIAHILKDLVKSDNTSVYLENFVSSFIDVGSERVLRMLNLPTDFTGVFLYAVSLFYDYKTYYASDVTNFRLITPSEVVNRIVYEVINKEFSANAARTKRGSRQVIKIPKDIVIRRLQTTMTNISEDSNISPFRSIMASLSVSQKGHNGVNIEGAFNMKRRIFNQNNYGAETMATPYSAQAGITKYLPFNPNIKDVTGVYKINGGPEGLDVSNLTSFVNAYIPYSFNDDAPRIIMANGQFNHILPVVGADPMLVSTGADEAAAYMTPSFSYVGEGDGEVVKVNDKFISVKYKDSKLGTIVYRLDNVERNAAKGYFMKNDFIIDPKFAKVGKKIKKGDLIAYNKNFYKKKANGKVALCAGSLVFALICDGEHVWEDSVIVSENLSGKLATPLIKRISVRFNMSKTEILDSNLDIGGNVTPDTLLFKTNSLTEDDALNEFYADIEGVNTRETTAHYKGIINDVTVYYRNKSTETMNPSVKNFLTQITTIQRNKNHMNDLDKETSKFGREIKTSEPIELTRGKFSKINGDNIENGEMLVEFHIQVLDKVGPSDKVVIDRALKGEPSLIIADEDRPYGELTGRVADIIADTQGVGARKTNGLPLHGDLLSILLHIAVSNRRILNRPAEPGSFLDYKSSYKMVEEDRKRGK